MKVEEEPILAQEVRNFVMKRWVRRPFLGRLRLLRRLRSFGGLRFLGRHDGNGYLFDVKDDINGV